MKTKQNVNEPLPASDLLGIGARPGCKNCKTRCWIHRATGGIKNHFRATWHNIFGHPASELLWLLGFKRASWWLHNVTSPRWVKMKKRGVEKKDGVFAPRE